RSAGNLFFDDEPPRASPLTASLGADKANLLLTEGPGVRAAPAVDAPLPRPASGAIGVDGPALPVNEHTPAAVGQVPTEGNMTRAGGFAPHAERPGPEARGAGVGIRIAAVRAGPEPLDMPRSVR